MMDPQLERTISKARKLRELRRAKQRVKRLERELGGEAALPEQSGYVPEYLRAIAALPPPGRTPRPQTRFFAPDADLDVNPPPDSARTGR